MVGRETEITEREEQTDTVVKEIVAHIVGDFEVIDVVDLVEDHLEVILIEVDSEDRLGDMVEVEEEEEEEVLDVVDHPVDELSLF